MTIILHDHDQTIRIGHVPPATVLEHEHGCPNAVHECRGCNARVPMQVRYCEGCA